MALQGTTRSALQDSPSFEQLMVEYRTGDSIQARNQIIRRLLLLDDEYFQTYSNRLSRGRALADTASDIVNTSLTTAATAVNPAATAKVLTGIAAGLQASKLSVDKNIFLQQTAPALIAKMEAQRTEIDAHIQQFLMKSVDVYPLEEGMRDFIKYYRAGTLSAAALSISADAESQRNNANETLQTTKTTPTSLKQIFASQHQKTYTLAPPPPPLPPPAPPVELKNAQAQIKKVGSVTDEEARSILQAKAVEVPAGESAIEALAEKILKKAELPHYKPDANTTLSAQASITLYRVRAGEDLERTKKLADACAGFVP